MAPGPNGAAGGFDPEQERRRRLAAQSLDADALLVEVVWHQHWATFDISNLELQHLSADQLWARHVRPALEAIGAPVGTGLTPEALAGRQDAGVPDGPLPES